MKKIKILLAEDEISLGQIIKESLETRDFEVILCENGKIAYQKYVEFKPELLVLDVMMPIKDGFTLAKEIRKMDKNIPIIFLTSKSQTQDVIDGFEIGCNDYIKKPFSMEELIVRIKSLLKKDNSLANNIIEIGKYTFDVKAQTLKTEDYSEILSHKANQLLLLLVLNKNQIINRKELLNKIWENDDFFSGRSMDVYITQLRKKLQKDASIQIINIRGLGYKIVY
ncbi:MAG: response regulator transcription factor [Flavobacterium sp.]